MFGLIIKIKKGFVSIEESVREQYVPNLPGVQPRRRFMYVSVASSIGEMFGGVGDWVCDSGWGMFRDENLECFFFLIIRESVKNLCHDFQPFRS